MFHRLTLPLVQGLGFRVASPNSGNATTEVGLGAMAFSGEADPVLGGDYSNKQLSRMSGQRRVLFGDPSPHLFEHTLMMFTEWQR